MANMRIGKTASSAEYQRDGQFQHRQVLEPNFGFLIRTIPKIFNLSNSKNFQFGKFEKRRNCKFHKL